jgi:hypothetical protein
MRNRNQPHRQIYNRQQLNKQALKNRQITGPRRQKKLNIAKDIINEIEKEENEIEMAEEEKKEKAGEEEKSVKNENEEEKEPKKKQERLKLDAKTLLYNTDNGLKKFYDVITTTKFNSEDNTKNLDKLINLTRNWHFMLFPNYDFDYFTNKLISLGKQAPTKAYMSRVRRIYKGEEKWDIIYDEQAQILGKASLMNKGNKEFVNPNPENLNENKENNNKEKENINISNNKKNDFEFNAEEQGIIQDLFLKDEILEENDKNENNKKEKKDENEKKNDINEEFDVKDSDFDNFPQDYNPEEEYEKTNLVSNLKNPSLHESLLNSHENKQSALSGLEIDDTLKPKIREHSNLKEKRTSDQIFGNNENNENDEKLNPELTKKQMVIE